MCQHSRDNYLLIYYCRGRERLLKLGAAIGPGASKLITIVHQRTYQRWVREKTSGKKPKKMGRPRILESIREIVIRLARETGWGYNRILGELRKLRIRYVSQSTIKNILKEEGIKPSPKRGSGTWDEFLKAHVETLWQVDFFSKMIWTPTGLRQAFVLAFIHLGTRRVICSLCSFKPDAKWMVSQAHAFIERWVKSIKIESLDFFIVFGKKHLDYIVSSYLLSLPIWNFITKCAHINPWITGRSLESGLRSMIHSQNVSRSSATNGSVACFDITNASLRE